MPALLRTRTLCALIGVVLLLVQATNASSYAICSNEGVVACFGDDRKIYEPGVSRPPSGILSCDSGKLVISGPPNFPIGQSPFCCDPEGKCD
ncbi:hypothetical protein DFH28DRAFT_980766 [Melampsora americana]|nr:hypothetical protein DFH28DRAFT_980766 [Melampsora americana]